MRFDRIGCLRIRGTRRGLKEPKFKKTAGKKRAYCSRYQSLFRPSPSRSRHDAHLSGRLSWRPLSLFDAGFAPGLLDKDLPKSVQIFNAISRKVFRELHHDLALSEGRAGFTNVLLFRLVILLTRKGKRGASPSGVGAPVPFSITSTCSIDAPASISSTNNQSFLSRNALRTGLKAIADTPLGSKELRAIGIGFD